MAVLRERLRKFDRVCESGCCSESGLDQGAGKNLLERLCAENRPEGFEYLGNRVLSFGGR